MRIFSVASVRALFCLAVLLGATPAVADKWTPGATVRVATEGAYRPWNFRSKGGPIIGFEIDLTKLLCADLKFKCVIQAERWVSMLPRLAAGRFDIVFAGMSITEARKTKARFTRPYAAAPAVFVAPDGARLPGTTLSAITLPDVSGSEEAAVVALRKALLNGVVGVQKGTTHEVFLRDYIEGYARVRTYERQSVLDKDVAAGKLSAMLVSLGYAVPLTGRKAGAGLKMIGPRISGGPFGAGIGAAVQRADAGLAAKFSGAIGKRLADGSIRKLSLKWFGYDLSAQP